MRKQMKSFAESAVRVLLVTFLLVNYFQRISNKNKNLLNSIF